MDISSEVRIKDLFAQFLRGGKKVLAAVLVFAIIFGGFKLLSEKKNAVSQGAYEESLKEYEKQKRDLEKKIARAETKAEQASLYLDESPICTLDPYNVARTTCFLSVNLDASVIAARALPGEASSSEILNNALKAIVLRYNTFFSGSNLQEILPSCANVPDRHIRELLSVREEGNGVIRITVSQNTEQEAEKLAQELVDAFLGEQENVAATTYPHTLSVLEFSTKRVIDTDIASKQSSQQDTLDSNQDNLRDYRKQLEELKAPSAPIDFSMKGSIKTGLVWALIGAVVGLLLSFVCCLISWLSNNTLLSSYQAEQQLKLVFLGSLANKKKGSCRWADKLSKERFWDDAETGKRFLKANVELLLRPGDNVVIASSLTANKAPLTRLVEAFRELGTDVSAVSGANSNPDYLTALGEGRKVILALRPGVSSLGMAKELKELSDRAGDAVVGFVLF